MILTHGAAQRNPRAPDRVPSAMHSLHRSSRNQLPASCFAGLLVRNYLLAAVNRAMATRVPLSANKSHHLSYRTVVTSELPLPPGVYFQVLPQIDAVLFQTTRLNDLLRSDMFLSKFHVFWKLTVNYCTDKATEKHSLIK